MAKPSLMPPEWEEIFRRVLELPGVRDKVRARTNLESLAGRRVPLSLFNTLVAQLTIELPQLSDADRALNNLERFFAAARSPLSLTALFDRDRKAIPILLRLFSSSQHLADLMIRDPASYDLLRLTAGQPVAREYLVDEISLLLETVDADDRTQAMRILRRFRNREILRIAFGDIVARQRLETVVGQISYLADAGCEAALAFAQRHLALRYGRPVTRDGEPITTTVLALGKLGGNELNYSSDIDLVMFYSAEGHTDGGHRIDAHDYHERLARNLHGLLSEPAAGGVAWRVDYRLRPNGSAGPLTNSVPRALSYYDMRGRTWERQAFLKARPVAGDLVLGQRLLDRLTPWIFEHRFDTSAISHVRSLKHQIERRAIVEGDTETNIKTGIGGIRDIEFIVQFLQLLHGSAIPEIRSGNTLDALERLVRCGCLRPNEHELLTRGYRWLRRLEHRLQLMFDLQTHSLPEDDDELRRVAIRTGLPDETSFPVAETESDNPLILEQFRAAFLETTGHHRTMLDHILHAAFPEGEDGEGSEEADLILQANYDATWVGDVLGRYGFRDPEQAWRSLMSLASEECRFLPSYRSRHFLAAIAQPLLAEIGGTPAPDATLKRLSTVSGSLGGKAALWELFRANPSTMQLYVRLCGGCDYLCDLLTRNPGMVDGLMDSLVLQKLPTRRFLRSALAELVRNAEDTDPIIHSFRDAQHLRVGVRDVTGQDDIAATQRALADIAEVCLTQIAGEESRRLQARYGRPLRMDGTESELMILALGKLGGREPNYHSDLDLMFVYFSRGNAVTMEGRDSTTHQDFFSRLAANISRRVSETGRWGKLYEVDSRLRPTGKSGSLAVSANEVNRYFASGQGQLWERLALCRARPVGCPPERAAVGRHLVHGIITGLSWSADSVAELVAMRLRMEENATPNNIKRGSGGSVDVEFLAQMLQLRFGREVPEVLQTNTAEALDALADSGCLNREEADVLIGSYRTLRQIESRVRLMNTTARHDVPDNEGDLARLAWLMRRESPAALMAEVDAIRTDNRRRFLELTERLERDSGPDLPVPPGSPAPPPNA